MTTLTFEEGFRRLYEIISNEKKDVILEKEPPSEQKPLFSPFASIAASSDDIDDANDDDIVGVGRAEKSIVASHLIRVGMTKKDYKEYESFFFKANKDLLRDAFLSAAELAAGISAAFETLSYIVTQGRRFANLEKDQIIEAVGREANRQISMHKSESSLDNALKKFLAIAGQGNGHIIEPSVRYKGGYDFNIMGPPAAQGKINDDVPCISFPRKEHSVPFITNGSKENDFIYKRDYLEAYSTELSAACIRAGEKIMQLLIGDSSLSAQDVAKRLHKQHSLSFNFAQINDIIFRETGIPLPKDFVENLDGVITKPLSKFISLVAVRYPKQDVVRFSHHREMKRRSGEVNTVQGESIEERITKEGLALSNNVSFTVCVSLPKHICNYISQSEDGEAISLLSLSNWFNMWTRAYVRAKYARATKNTGDKATEKGVNPRDIPRFVLPLSKMQKARDIREQNGLHTEKGKGDEHNIVIAPNGGLRFALPADKRESARANLENFEKDTEDYLNFCYAHGIPADGVKTLADVILCSTNSKEIEERHRELVSKLDTYKGKLLSFDWDYNNIVTANATNPITIVTTDTVGTAKPDPSTLADYLGFNFAREGEAPIKKNFIASLMLVTNSGLQNVDAKNRPESKITNYNSPCAFLETTEVSGGLLDFYTYQAKKGRVPSVSDLIKLAAERLGYPSLPDSQEMFSFGDVIKNDLTPGGGFNQESVQEGFFVRTALEVGMRYANSSYELRSLVVAENPGVTGMDLEDLILEHPHYFDPNKGTLVDFGNLYNNIGGMIFKIAMESLVDLSDSWLLSIEPPVFVGPNRRILQKATYAQVADKIMPLAVLFASYVPNAEQIFRKAEEQVEINQPDPSITIEDIKMSGSTGGQLFPHQFGTHQALRRRPKWGVLDIAPGGGKTGLGVGDVAALVTELDELGEEQVRPLILCPDNLIKNWVDDMQIFTGNNWNMIPVNTNVLNRWGYEAVDKLLSDAPVNTIVVAGFNFLKNKAETLSIGTHKVKVSNNLELIKRYGFDYILIDESHKLKNKMSLVHRTIKQLTTASHVRYVRLATGTLITNRVDDVVGQSSLFNGHIFRENEIPRDLSPEDAIKMAQEEKSVELNGDRVPVWRVITPQRTRRKISQFASVISYRKKHWAFMLPSPIETFFPIPVVPRVEDGATEKDIRLGELHKELYDLVVSEEIEKIEGLKAAAKRASRAKDDDDDDDDDDDTGDADNTDIDIDEKDEFADIDQQSLKNSLNRIEMLVTNPMSDELAPLVFGAAGVTEYHSTKARFIARRIEKHFNPEKWSKDKHYLETTLVEYNGETWLTRKLNKSTPRPELMPEETVGIPPDQNTDFWKKEPEGKVLVVCRFSNTVEGVFNALPEEYQRMAVRYTGREADKLSNFESFVNDPKVKIMIANEQGISEGHNLQIASRLIRVESPWAPGDLDQTESRLFRPDPKAQKNAFEGKSGDLYREVIFLDWVVADNTMEVRKQARLIAKSFEKMKFDESENPLYQDTFDAESNQLEPLPMNMDAIESRASLEDYGQYVSAYAELNGVIRQEFSQMRATMDTSMIDIVPHEGVKGSKIIQTPYTPNQKPRDPDNLGLVTLKAYVRLPEVLENLTEDSLEGTFVVTDKGKGQIAAVSLRYKKELIMLPDGSFEKTPSGKQYKRRDALDARGNKILDKDPIRNFKVKLSGSNEVYVLNNTGVVFVPMNKKNVKAKEFYVKDLLTTQTEIKQEERRKEAESRKNRRGAIARHEAEEERRLLEEARRRRKAKKEAEANSRASEDGRKRKKNLEEGKPINKGIRRVKEVPAIDKVVADKSIRLEPAFYHGYLTLELMANDPDAGELKKLGFKSTGPYAYADITRYNRYEKFLDYVEEHFELGAPAVKRLDAVQDAFEEGLRGPYKMELAPMSSLTYFFAVSKRRVKNRKEIRPFPIILPDSLKIAVDIETCPIIRKHIGKAIPGASTKWQEHPGHLLYFARSKADLRAKVKSLRKEGFVIENLEELDEDIKNISFRASKGAND